MFRIFLTCALSCATALSQTANPGAQPAPAAQGQQRPALAPGAPQPVDPTVSQLLPDTVVVTIHGLCPLGSGHALSDSCETKMTKEQLDKMLNAVNYEGHMLNRVSTRAFVENYAQLLVLAAAAQEVGIESDPEFQELMKVVRVRTLADAYRRGLHERFRNVTDKDYETYYQENLDKFTRLQIDRVFIPRVNPRLPRDKQTEFAKRAQQAADDIRERASRGEDVNQLQAEAYKTLGLPSAPKTDMGPRNRGSFPLATWQRLFVLKAGESTKVETEPAGFSFYRVRSRDVAPLASVKGTLVDEIARKNTESALQSLLKRVHSEVNDQFFSTQPLGAPAQLGPLRNMPRQNNAPAPSQQKPAPPATQDKRQ